MKTFLKHFFTLFFAIFLITLTSCFFDFGQTDEEELVEAGTVTFDFNASGTPTDGGKVYAVLFNPTLTPLKNIRHITGASGVTGFNAVPNHTDALYSAPQAQGVPNGGAFPQNIHFHPKDEIRELMKKNNGARSAGPLGNRAAPPHPEPQLGENDGSIYIDTKINIETGEVVYGYSEVTKGYDGANCTVWFYDKKKSDSSYTIFANETTWKEKCSDIGTAFENACGKVRTLFGNESDQLIPPTGYTLVDMSDKKVNIVLYDIAPLSETEVNAMISEYVKHGLTITEDEVRANGVQGYFSGKDYYNFSEYQGRQTYSNKGKFFYVDAYAVKVAPKEAISTLVHEFQHMIHLNQKTFKNVDTSTWFNELLSLACEDAMKEHINAGGVAGLKGRLQDFNQYYWLSGIEYATDNGATVMSYATLYTFGAYLTRTYGGVKLINAMSTNEHADEKAIIEAIKSCNFTKTAGGSDLNMRNLIMEFSENVLLGKENVGLKKEITNSKVSDSGTNSFTLKALDLRGENYKWALGNINDEYYYNQKTSDSNYALGPLIFKPGAFSTGATLRPYGFIYYYLGKATGSSITVSLTGGAKNQEVFLVYE